MIREAIRRELAREGDRSTSSTTAWHLKKMSGRLHRLVPEALHRHRARADA